MSWNIGRGGHKNKKSIQENLNHVLLKAMSYDHVQQCNSKINEWCYKQKGQCHVSNAAIIAKRFAVGDMNPSHNGTH